jgi:hypothetical protein
MQLVIPLKPVPNQTVQVQLGAQPVTLNVYQLAYGLFIDVFVGNVLVAPSVICENINRIVRSIYLGFAGDLAFLDLQGSSDPVYTGLGSRYVLVYDDAAFGLAGQF